MRRFLPRMGRRTRMRWAPRLVGMAVIGIMMALASTPPQSLQALNNLVLDQYQVIKPRIYHDDIPVRIIDIDSESIERVGQWPWSRLTMAKLNNRLAQAGAGVVAYDIIFSEPDRTSPANLAALLGENPAGTFDPASLSGLVDHDLLFTNSIAQSNTVLGFFLLSSLNENRPATLHSYGYGGSDPTNVLLDYNGALTSMSSFGNAASGEGYVSFVPERDGIVRSAPLFQRIDERVFPALSIEALRAAQGASSYVLRSSDGTQQLGTATGMAAARVGQFTVATDRRGRFPMYFAQPSEEIRRKRLVPAWKILDNNVPASEWSDRIAGHIVFVGTSADGLKDLVATPLSGRYEGVGVHAEVVEQIIGEEMYGAQILQRPYWAEVVEQLTLILAGVVMIILLPRLGAAWGAVLSGTLIAVIAAYSWSRFSADLVLISPVYPIIAIALTYLAMTVTSFWLTETERSQIQGAFSRYLSPAMVSKVSDDPDLLVLGGEERMMTILFLDIRSFSKISESMEPQEIVGFLNLFLTPMTDTLQSNHATIDKYIGDAIVAFWNAPLDDANHERHAVEAVLAMGQTLRELRARYDDQDAVKWPNNLSMGIGLNTGVCCVGNLGSEQRFSYSMIGDAANLASRIEGLTKQYRTETLIGDATAHAVSDFALLDADLIRVVGRQTPERIWLLVGDEALASTDEFKALRAEHERFIGEYRTRQWDAAIARLDGLAAQARPFGQDGYYTVMAERIAQYEATPPEADWGGVFTATSK